MSYGPVPQPVHWSPAPPLPMPAPPRRRTAGWWGGYVVCLVSGALALLIAHDGTVQARQVEADDALAELAGRAFIGLMGMAMTTAAVLAFIAATVIAAVGLRGPARWVAPALSGFAALGSLALMGAWFLGWLF